MQGSYEWHCDRAGKATASEFDLIMNRPGSWKRYAEKIRKDRDQLLSGTLTTNNIDHVPAIAWGKKYESKARAEFEFRHQVDVNVPDFRDLSSASMIGCSADGIYKTDNVLCGIEIKCPFNESNHFLTIADGMPYKHMAQVQGCIWIWGLKGIYFISYDPRQHGIHQYYEQWIPRDDKYIQTLDRKVHKFLEYVDSGEIITSTSIPSLF